MTAATILDTPESAMSDGRCSFDTSPSDTAQAATDYSARDYRACGRTPVVATWYAVQWPSRRREPISGLCAVHDRHAQRATDALPFTQRMYEREAI